MKFIFLYNIKEFACGKELKKAKTKTRNNKKQQQKMFVKFSLKFKHIYITTCTGIIMVYELMKVAFVYFNILCFVLNFADSLLFPLQIPRPFIMNPTTHHIK